MAFIGVQYLLSPHVANTDLAHPPTSVQNIICCMLQVQVICFAVQTSPSRVCPPLKQTSEPHVSRMGPTSLHLCL